MRKISKIKKGAKVAILSPSFAAPGKWPAVYEFGLKRLRENFGLIPVEFPATKKIGASKEERSKDLINAFENKNISAIITSLGGNDQVTYIKNLPKEPFIKNPKAFFGYSDNTHFMNFLWLCGIPSYYGGAVLTQFAMNGDMDEFTMRYLKYALFESGEKELKVSEVFNDVGLDWGDKNLLDKKRMYEKNDGWFWDGNNDAKGISWGGCVESIDEILRHGIKMPTLEQFEQCILFMETSEEIPSSDYVFRVYRALGERGILERVKGILIGRPKAWEFNKQQSTEEKDLYRKNQRETILRAVRLYNKKVPIIQNVDFGHTDPQIALPYGQKTRIDSATRKIFAKF